MRYDEMIENLRRGGYDVSRYVKHAPGADEEAMNRASLTIGQLADILDETVHRRVAPLERRIAELEGRELAKSVVVPPSKPRVLALPPRDEGKPRVRLRSVAR